VSDQGEARDINRILEVIQEQLDAQARVIYSATVIEHAHQPRNWGRMDRADARKIWQGPCGDTMEIYLCLDKEGTGKAAISEISFVTDGCGPSVACGSMLTTMARGMTLEQAAKIQPRDLLIALGGLPQKSAHCAFLAVHTLQEAVGDWYRSVHQRSKEADEE
jgi:nitrogen fixation NifU-like protein